MVFRPVWWQATGVGSVAGFTSTLAHAAGPVTTMYMLPQRLSKEQYVATTVLYYWIGNQLKLPVYVAMNMVNRKSLLVGLVLLPAVPVGAWLGKYLAKRISQKVFTAIVYTLLAGAGVYLCKDAIQALWS